MKCIPVYFSGNYAGEKPFIAGKACAGCQPGWGCEDDAFCGKTASATQALLLVLPLHINFMMMILWCVALSLSTGRQIAKLLYTIFPHGIKLYLVLLLGRSCPLSHFPK